MTITTAFLLDTHSATMSTDEEAQAIKQVFRLAGISIDGPVITPRQLDQVDVDMVILDYGGLASQWGSDWVLQSWVEAARRWAEDHPSGLMVIFSGWPSHRYRHDLAAYGPVPPNIVFHHDWNADATWQLVRATYGDKC